jgi:hypothetical protein
MLRFLSRYISLNVNDFILLKSVCTDSVTPNRESNLFFKYKKEILFAGEGRLGFQSFHNHFIKDIQNSSAKQTFAVTDLQTLLFASQETSLVPSCM